jgi:hypothetical protein
VNCPVEGSIATSWLPDVSLAHAPGAGLVPADSARARRGLVVVWPRVLHQSPVSRIEVAQPRHRLLPEPDGAVGGDRRGGRFPVRRGERVLCDPADRRRRGELRSQRLRASQWVGAARGWVELAVGVVTSHRRHKEEQDDCQHADSRWPLGHRHSSHDQVLKRFLFCDSSRTSQQEASGLLPETSRLIPRQHLVYYAPHRSFLTRPLMWPMISSSDVPGPYSPEMPSFRSLGLSSSGMMPPPVTMMSFPPYFSSSLLT